jgi:hypothetical protein
MGEPPLRNRKVFNFRVQRSQHSQAASAGYYMKSSKETGNLDTARRIYYGFIFMSIATLLI